MLRTTLTVLTTSLLAASVQAFEGTFPILAVSSHPLNSIHSLNPSHKSSHVNPFSQANKDGQTVLAEDGQVVGNDDDLCSLDNILLINARGLHNSDIAFLPSISSSPYGVRSLLSSSSDRSLVLPYNKKSRTHAHAHKSSNTVDKALKRFVKQCGATIERQNEKNFWAGEQGKTVRVVDVEGLDQWLLTGETARANRREIMQELESKLLEHLPSLSAPYLLIISDVPSLPTSFSSSPSSSSHHQKRQENIEAAFESIYGSDELANDLAAWTGGAFDTGKSIASQAANATKSIFAVDPKSGLLHRYIFFTPSLIFALLVTLIILVPVLIFTSTALTTTETFKGLESKMTGSVGLDPSKA